MSNTLLYHQVCQNEAELIARCQAIEGFTLGQLATHCSITIPDNPLKRKGWAGMAVELALGANAGNQSLPDFTHLGVELKTLPMNHLGKPAESTFVTAIPLLTIHKQTWQTSQCYAKLKRVLWLPIEDDSTIPYAHRRIGRGSLWSPSSEEETILANDWAELTLLISTGFLAEINASMGDYLQIRPKAANAKSLCYGFDEQGNKVLTLPRGFYLRSSFTARILA
ncbi:MAG: DNA mismatch repair endonuclease MutH [Legionellaceae bacterium]|nr:DNA mismatch repair endonuclease MutH [Legionellaceae bacterium]